MKICPTCNRLFRAAFLVCPSDGHVLRVLREWRPGETPTEKYLIIEKIAHGSMGPAYRAEVLPGGGNRILKLLASQLAEDEDVVQAFREAIEAIRDLRHKNVGRVESFERAKDGRPFIVMEYFPGLALRELMLRQGPMSPSYVRAVATQVCSALDSGHSSGILHRNLKPENILIMEESDGRLLVKVMEFGLSPAREAAALHDKPIADVEMTTFGPVVGLCEYIAPEQSAGSRGGALDGRADIYSLGAVMFEALTGDIPHFVEDLPGRLSQSLDAAKDERLFNAVLKALNHDPGDRHQSALEMAGDLHEMPHRSAPAAVLVHKSAGGERQAAIGQVNTRSTTRASHVSSDSFLAGTGGHMPREQKADSVRPSTAPMADSGPKPFPNPSDLYLDDLRKSLAGKDVTLSQSRRRSVAAWRGLPLALLTLLGLGGIWVTKQWSHKAGPGQVLPAENSQVVAPSPFQAPEGLGAESIGTSGESAVRPEVVQPAGLPPTETSHREETPNPQKGSGSPVSRAQLSSNTTSPAAAGRTQITEENAGVRTNRVPGGSTDQAAARAAALKQKMTDGWAYMERKNYQEAIKSFSQALEIDPASAEAQAALRVAGYALQHPGTELFSSPASETSEGPPRRQ